MKLTVKGLDQYQAKVEQILPAVKAAIKAALQHLEGKMKPYPPATLANQPKEYKKGGPNTWYQRGWGSKWALKGGDWHGRETSEQLQQSWTMTIDSTGLRGTIGNDTSYGPYVQGADDQSKAMRTIGWKTTKDVAEEEQQTVTDFVTDHIDKALSGK